MSPIVVALGTTDTETLADIARSIAEFRKREKAEWEALVKPASVANEPLTGIKALMKEALLRAQLARSQLFAPVGIGIAHGTVQLLYNKGARRADFEAHVIAGVAPQGPVAVAAPGAFPEEAESAYADEVHFCARSYLTTDETTSQADMLASLVVNAWSSRPFTFNPPTVVWLQ